MSTVQATYVVLTGEDDWTPLADVPADVLLELWGPEPTCCTLQGGFLFTIDGRPWNEDAIDEVRMSTTWIAATLALLGGRLSQSVWAWEESGMTLLRRDDELWAFDVHHSGQLICPLVKVDLAAFARAVAGAARVAAHRFDEVLARDDRQVLEDNLAYAWAEQADALERAADERLWTTAEPSDKPFPELHLALRLRDEAWLRRVADVDPDAAHEGTSSVGAAVSYRWPEGLRVLLEAGADVNRRDASQLSPLQRAANVWGPATDTAELLLAAGAELDLHSALALGRVRWILEHADLARGSPEILCPWVARIKTRVTAGADERATLAVWGPVADALIAGGASIGVTKRPGPWGWHQAPLQLAEQWKLELVAAFLRSRGA